MSARRVGAGRSSGDDNGLVKVEGVSVAFVEKSVGASRDEAGPQQADGAHGKKRMEQRCREGQKGTTTSGNLISPNSCTPRFLLAKRPLTASLTGGGSGESWTLSAEEPPIHSGQGTNPANLALPPFHRLLVLMVTPQGDAGRDREVLNWVAANATRGIECQ